MAGPESSPSQGDRRENTPASLGASVAQELLNHPSRTSKKIQELKEKDPSMLAAIAPLYAVLAHLITMPMLSDLTGMPISRAKLKLKDEKGVLSTSSPEVLELRMKPHGEFSGTKGEENAFVRLQMQGLVPYFESVVGQVMDSENPYNHIWREFADLSPQYFSKTEEDDSNRIESNNLHELKNPVSGLHMFFWEGLCAPMRVNLAADYSYSMTVNSVGQLQNQAINRGIVGLWAQQSEFSRGARNKRISGPYLQSDLVDQDVETGITTWGEYLSKGINAGVTKCVAPYGLLSPDERVREMCLAHNARVGIRNRSGTLFCPAGQEFDQVASASEVLAYYALLNAPSTLWLPFLESKKIIDWSDALPGTQLPNGGVMSHGEFTTNTSTYI